MSSPYVIGDIEGFTPEIARLVGMMTYVRRTTIDAVQGLTRAQLDHVHDANSNSIGAMLAHIAAVETAYQVGTFGLDESALAGLGPALDLGSKARELIRGRDLHHYLHELQRVRAVTFDEFAKRDDAWLYEERPFWRGQPANNYFQWFHVFEDELNHRGQIRWLVKRLP